MKRVLLSLVALVLSAAGIPVVSGWLVAPKPRSGEGGIRTLYAQAAPKQAVVETSAGFFTIDLAPDQAPNQTAYFMKQAAAGAYDGTIFHRVVKNGMVQGGYPLTKDAGTRALYVTGGQN